MDDFWDRRYSTPGHVYGQEPNAFLAAQAHRLRPGMRALAVADGEGRNGVWLAAQGLDVLSVDRSVVGLAKARRLAAQRGVPLATLATDLTTWSWPVAAFDVVASIFIHFEPATRTRMHRACEQALRPGGLLVLTAFTPEQLSRDSGGPESIELLYTAAELAGDFGGMEILQLEATVAVLDEGPGHQGPASVVQLLARRPP